MEKKYIVALGASAGGVAALSQFFDHTLPDSVSYIITTHLYPHQRSLLTEIIQKHSSLKVCEVKNNMPVMPNTVYVMPENKVMSISDGKLVLSKRDLSIKVNMAIDIFFRSLAKDTHFKKIAVILSGMGIEGTEGIKAIVQKGGYIIAQAPLSADEASMPRNVIEKGLANAVLDPEQMPQAIIHYIDSANP